MPRRLSELKININPQKELFKWGPIDFKLIYGSLFIETVLKKIFQYYPWNWPPTLCILKKQKIFWINDLNELQKAGLKYFKKYFLNLENHQKHWQKWENWVCEYKTMAEKLKNIDLQKISDKKFYDLLKEFYDFNIRFWLIVHVPEIANWGGEYLLKNKLIEIDKEKADKYLEILSAPVKFSFFQKEELDLLKINFIKNKTEYQKALRGHARKYHWLLNSYGGNRILRVNYFRKRLTELLKQDRAENHIKKIENIIKNNKARKKRLFKKLKLDENIILIAEQLSQSIWWQDLRKGYIWRMHYFWDNFLREIAHRTDWNFSELQLCHSYELLNIVKKKTINKNEILKRQKYYMFYAENGIFWDSVNEKIIKHIIKNYLTVKNVDDKIKGLVVSKNNNKKIKGRIKIINNPFKEGKNFKKGDILVTGMTSPEFILVMKKAKAIITDHGGMTSHAAIVSRELRVPCIVNTKIATKILRDGDLVEVDVNKSIIKILKKAT